MLMVLILARLSRRLLISTKSDYYYTLLVVVGYVKSFVGRRAISVEKVDVHEKGKRTMTGSEKGKSDRVLWWMDDKE